MQTDPSTSFYDDLPLNGNFVDMADAAQFHALPQDWYIGVSDIVGSTKAIAAGGYKTVNMIGAAVIAAQMNGAAGRAFPFVFGGDGAAFACPPDRAQQAGEALAAVRHWAQEEFSMGLRVALVPVSEIRSAGLDVRVARYRAAPGVDYAMFAGGGVSWAEAQMKAGRFDLNTAGPAQDPDLTGLSCRWSHMPARNGFILSLVVQPCDTGTPEQFAQICQQVVDLARNLDRGGHPVPDAGPGTSWPPAGATLEAHATRGTTPLARRKRQILFETFMAWVLIRTGLKLGGFDPRHYQRTVGQNADFRKFDDGLKMTLDCNEDTARAIETLLERARSDGILLYGMHRQDEAMMTCIVPSIMQDDHVHFVDGASGGYTQAATQIKAALAS